MLQTKSPKIEAQAFTQTFANELSDDLIKVVLFGSLVSGNFGPESDIVILLVVRDRAMTKAKRLADQLVTGRAYDTDYHTHLSPKIFSEAAYINATEPKPSSFMRKLLETGITLYDQGQKTT